MKKSFLILFICLVSCSVKSQISNFKEYQANINIAELLYISGDKSGSLKKYYTTLTSNKGNFIKDIYNALLIADEVQSKDTFFKILPLLYIKGLKNSILIEKKEFQKYHSDERWLAFLKTNEKYICPNPLLKARIDSLRQKDQEFRKMAGSYKVYGDTIKKIDSLNMLFIYTLVEQGIFPGEDEIGVNNFSGTQNYDIVFHHYTQSTSLDSNKRKPKITSIIVNLVQQGKLIPNRASHWMEMQNSDFKGGVFDVLNFVINDKETGYYVAKMSYEQSIVVEECRKWIGLEPLKDYYKKFLYKLHNPNSALNFDILRNTFHMGKDEEGFKKMIENMMPIK